MTRLVYGIACLVVPALWGLLVAKLYNHLADRRKKRDPDGEAPTEMYHI